MDVWLAAAKKDFNQEMLITWKSDPELADGHLQHQNENSICKSKIGAIYLTLGKIDLFCNAP